MHKYVPVFGGCNLIIIVLRMPVKAFHIPLAPERRLCYNVPSVTDGGTAGFCLQIRKGGTDMRLEKIDCGSGTIAVVSSDDIVITNVDSALDLLMSAKYEAGTEYLVVDKKAVTEDFFVLSSGLAGEILQKYINYGGKLAICNALAAVPLWYDRPTRSIALRYELI